MWKGALSMSTGLVAQAIGLEAQALDIARQKLFDDFVKAMIPSLFPDLTFYRNVVEVGFRDAQGGIVAALKARSMNATAVSFGGKESMSFTFEWCWVFAHNLQMVRRRNGFLSHARERHCNKVNVNSGIEPWHFKALHQAGAKFHRGRLCEQVADDGDVCVSLFNSVVTRCTRFLVHASLTSSSVTGSSMITRLGDGPAPCCANRDG